MTLVLVRYDEELPPALADAEVLDADADADLLLDAIFAAERVVVW